MKKERLEYIDFLKALLIPLVPLVHVGVVRLAPLGNICMMVFFLCSGFTSIDNSKSIKETIIHKIKKLILPYWVATLFYGFFEVWRGTYFGYANYKIIFPSILSMIYGSSGKVPCIPILKNVCIEAVSNMNELPPYGFIDIILPTSCHLWFLPAMFTGSVLYSIYKHYIKKHGIIDFIIILIFLSLSYIESLQMFPQLPYGLGRGFIACACMIVGMNLRYYDIISFKIKNYIILLICIIVIYVLFNPIANNAFFISSSYPMGNILGVYLLFILGISVSIFMLFLCKIICEKLNIKPNWFLQMGKNTMTIYLWHMIFLTFFGLIFIKILDIPIMMDVFKMAFIPEGRVGLMCLLSFLTLVMCMLIPKKFRI